MNFAEVEREVAKLRQDLAAGRLTEEQFKARLRGMMVEDEEGNWWMVGYETGEWYRHDGTDWVRADPPGRVALRTAPQLVAQEPVAPAKAKPQRLWGIAVLLLGLTLTFLAGLGAFFLAYSFAPDVDETIVSICGGAIWLGGFILTIIITRKVWRGK